MTRIWRHIREGFQGVTRHFALSLSSISSVTVTLLIMAAFLFLSSNLTEITKKVEQSVQIHVQVDKNYEAQDQLDRIEKEIKAIPGIAEVKFSSKDEELEAFIQLDESADSEQLFGPFRGENNPFTHAFLVQAVSGDQLVDATARISGVEGVYKAVYGGSATSTFISTLEQVRYIGVVIVAALGIVAIFLISNTIRVSIHSRRREISIMRTVGATNWYIRWPFIIEGMLIGLIGSIIPVLVSIFGYQYLYDATGGFLISRMFTLVPPSPLVYQSSLILVAIGVGVGAIGSLLSVGKLLRWTR